jgi:uncharacterized protein YprB with RNaseH-like and TPR domain
MSTLDRLRQLVRPSGPPSAPARELTYEQLDKHGQPLPERRDLPPLDGASTIDTPAGTCVVVDRVFHADSSHGRLVVEEAAVSASDVFAFCQKDSAALFGSRWREGLGREEADEEDATLRAHALRAARRAGARADSETSAAARGRPPSGHELSADAADDDAHADGEADPPVVFLDLETTGLSGGAGTVAFLVGCGFFRDGAFHTRQFFLTGFAAERALLHAVTSLLSRAACLVTYNGKTFDVPVMETRWLFHRVTPPWTELTHLDMVHVSRRLWRARGDLDEAGCRLVMLEHDLLGVTRFDDVPGYDIPERYFRYIRGGDPSLLEPVLHHNRLDLLSLACLTSRMLRLVREGADGAHDPQECLALGRELARLRDDPRADACFQAAADSPFASASVRAEALYALARRLRRGRRYHEAALVWRRLIASNAPRDLLHSEAREALAVHYEHRDRDLDAAHEWATDGYRVESDGARRDAFAHRLARLKRKMAVHAKGGPQTAFSFVPLED